MEVRRKCGCGQRRNDEYDRRCMGKTGMGPEARVREKYIQTL